MTERKRYIEPVTTYGWLALAFVSLVQNAVEIRVQLLEAGWVPPQHYARTSPIASTTDRQEPTGAAQAHAGQQFDLALEVKQGAAELTQQVALDELTKNRAAVVVSQPDESRPVIEQQERAETLKQQMEQLKRGLEGIPEAAKTLLDEQAEVQPPEIRKLLETHVGAQRELRQQFEDKQREQSLFEEKLEKDYFESHPDQSQAERLRDEQKFEGAKQRNREDLLTRQEAQMAELLQEQQEQLQRLQRDQESQGQKEAQLRQAFEQNKDDMFR